MGPLTHLLTAPVALPLNGLLWIARQVAEAVDQQMLDPGRIEAALLALERQLEDGAIDEAAFETGEAALFEELKAIRAALAARAAAAAAASAP